VTKHVAETKEILLGPAYTASALYDFPDPIHEGVTPREQQCRAHRDGWYTNNLPARRWTKPVHNGTRPRRVRGVDELLQGGSIPLGKTAHHVRQHPRLKSGVKP